MDYELLLKTKIKEKIDIVYIDPPYDSDFVIKSLKNIIDKELVKDDSTIIIETDDEQRILDDLKEMKVEITDKRKYGRAILIFLKIRKG